MHHKHHEKLEKLKEAIKTHKELDELEKSNAIAHIEEWYIEDKADKVVWQDLKEKLLEISSKIEPILKEIGLI